MVKVSSTALLRREQELQRRNPSRSFARRGLSGVSTILPGTMLLDWTTGGNDMPVAKKSGGTIRPGPYESLSHQRKRVGQSLH